jgi:hypothetical protein
MLRSAKQIGLADVLARFAKLMPKLLTVSGETKEAGEQEQAEKPAIVDVSRHSLFGHQLRTGLSRRGCNLTKRFKL